MWVAASFLAQVKLTVLPLPIYIFPGRLTGLSSVKVVLVHLSSCSKIELHAYVTTALNKSVASSMETTCIGCFPDPSSIIIALEHHSSGPLQLYNMYFPELRGYEVVCCMLCLSHLFVGIFAIPRSRKYYLFWREVWPFHYKVYAGL